MNTAYRLVRIRQALVVATTLATIVDQVIGDAPPGPARNELIDAGSDLLDLRDHLERAARLTDPAAADPLVRRADESRTVAGS